VSAATQLTGVERIAEAFRSVRADSRRAALMPYLMGGFPSLETSLQVGRACGDAGADLLEVGVPFSDPLADGPVIHAAGTAALRAGATVLRVLDLAGAIAAGGPPVVVMCYSNQVFASGLERFAKMLVERGISGLIVPDLPLEEAGEALRACDACGLALVPLVAPTTPEQRLRAIGERARAFLYAVSVTGTTGERGSLPDTLPGLIARARRHTYVPVAAGFGIATPRQAREAADAGADGVIVGSRLVRAAGEAGDPPAAVGALVGDFAAALSPGAETANE
jgi:tryptophan synthase alpha chain